MRNCIIWGWEFHTRDIKTRHESHSTNQSPALLIPTTAPELLLLGPQTLARQEQWLIQQNMTMMDYIIFYEIRHVIGCCSLKYLYIEIKTFLSDKMQSFWKTTADSSTISHKMDELVIPLGEVSSHISVVNWFVSINLICQVELISSI